MARDRDGWHAIDVVVIGTRGFLRAVARKAVGHAIRLVPEVSTSCCTRSRWPRDSIGVGTRSCTTNHRCMRFDFAVYSGKVLPVESERERGGGGAGSHSFPNGNTFVL